jgi:hypothetical protein
MTTPVVVVFSKGFHISFPLPSNFFPAILRTGFSLSQSTPPHPSCCCSENRMVLICLGNLLVNSCFLPPCHHTRASSSLNFPSIHSVIRCPPAYPHFPLYDMTCLVYALYTTFTKLMTCVYFYYCLPFIRPFRAPHCSAPLPSLIGRSVRRFIIAPHPTKTSSVLYLIIVHVPP